MRRWLRRLDAWVEGAATFLCGPRAEGDPPAPLPWKLAGLALTGVGMVLVWLQARGLP
jgi:hypothetical protein